MRPAILLTSKLSSALECASKVGNVERAAVLKSLRVYGTVSLIISSSAVAASVHLPIFARQ
jgi:hypothetical protein